MVDRSGMADTPLARAMTPDPVVVAPSDRAIDALRIMTEHGFRHLPVVDEDNRVLALVSIRDLLRHQFERLKNEIEALTSYVGADGPGG